MMGLESRSLSIDEGVFALVSLSGMSGSQFSEERQGESREVLRERIREVEELVEAINEEQLRCEGVKSEIDECKLRYFTYRDSLVQ